MRVLSTPAVLSSIILGGWLSCAAAQDMGLDAPNALSSAQDEQATGSEDLSAGVIPRPTIDSPGTVMGITLGELYTDNLRLAPSNKPKQASWITQIQPFVRWAGSGPRFSGLLDYRMTGYLYAGNSRYNQLTQNLNARGTFSILPQHLFIDGTARYGSAVIDNQLPTGSGAFYLNNNRANVATGTLSPYWLQDLGRVGTMALRYTLGRVMYNDRGISGQDAGRLNGISDITSNTLQFNLVSPDYQVWGWNFGYVDQRIEADSGRSAEYATVKLGVSRQISNNTRLLADVGKENKFLPDGTTRRLDASFWDAGFNWSNTRDSLRLLVGHRFYGRSYHMSWTRTAALLTTAVSYVERPTDLNQQLLGQNLGQAITPSIGSLRIPSLRMRRVYLMKRATASATYTMPTSSLRLALYDERRTYFMLDNRQEKIVNANIAWRFDIGPFTTLTPTVGWQRYQFQDGQISHNKYAQLALRHQVNPNDSVSVRLRSNSRDVDFGVPGAHGYRVNVIFVQWTHLF